MLTTIKGLFRYSPSFRYGAIILLFVVILVGLSFVAPYEQNARRVVPLNQPPSGEFILGTNSSGQDMFWLMTYGLRNSLIIAGVAVIIGRGIGVFLGMISGYLGGNIDRVLSSIVDSFIVVPRLPLLILIAFILRGQITTFTLALLIGLLDWAFPSKRYRSQILSLKEREFTHTAVFSGMSSSKIVIKEHLPFIIPFLLADVVSGFLFAIGFEVTLSVLGLGDLNTPSIGTMIYWGNYYQALLANRVWVLAAPIAASIVVVVGFYLVSIGLSEYLDPRTRLARLQAAGG
ncbi:MAG: ABC transporter permease [Anaerolineales bacterium]|nr:ABC transporter permease [Anaerolineales bacterium]MCB0011927.1 ABC transporter permease [Anaerolineales bacterium]MCB0019722.1 ABC transporter permease [Anaerolineales bacterium]MCB0031483.1 ABC transporter permease [Anaerolineales bacterium]MCB8960250.1 ABC transporter permease [Ardenticatenales bacterium]